MFGEFLLCVSFSHTKVEEFTVLVFEDDVSGIRFRLGFVGIGRVGFRDNWLWCESRVFLWVLLIGWLFGRGFGRVLGFLFGLSGMFISVSIW
jgi:hypothetical protein